MYYDENKGLLKEIKPVASREYLSKTKFIGCTRIIISIFFTIFIGLFSIAIFDFLNFFLRINFPFPEWVIIMGWFGILLITIPHVFDFFVINALRNITYRIYEDRINYRSFFPVFVDTDIDIKNIVEISIWQSDDQKGTDIGTLSLSLKNSKNAPMFFIPELDENKQLIKDLINKQ